MTEPQPQPHEHEVEGWPFPVPANAEVITTRPILEDGLPIRLVARDADDGSWQILCGTTNDTSEGRVACFGCLFEKDTTLAELADLPAGWHAQRDEVGGAWTRVKPRTGMEILRETVETEGYQILLLPPRRPLWAFTVGLGISYSQPDVLVFGLPPQVMHAMIGTLAQLAANGEKLEHGYRTDEVLERFTCELRAMDPRWVELLAAPNKEFYGDKPCPMLQCVWPDKQGKLLHEEGFDDNYRVRQPQLELADPDKAGMRPLLRAMEKT